MDLSLATELVAGSGPYATAYLDVSREHENAPREIELRWRALRGQLTEQGASEDSVRALDEAVGTESPVAGVGGRCIVAEGGEVLLDRLLPDPPYSSEARWSRVPHLWPYLAQQPEMVPYVVAVVDRTGADMYSFEPSRTGRTRVARDAVVEGGDRPITKVATGGWSQRRYQQRAENLWQANAKQVAEEADRLVKEVHAELLIVAGDPRARSALAGELSGRSREVLVETEASGRGLGASVDSLAEAVSDLVEQAYQARLRYTVEAFGRQDSPCDGLADTVAALRERRVDTLLIREDTTSERTVFVGPAADQVAVHAQELEELGVAEPGRAQLEDALVRAAAAGDSSLIVLSSRRGEPDLATGAGSDAPGLRLRDGVGFLARY